MRRKAVAFLIALAMMLSGCSTLMDGAYVWTQPYRGDAPSGTGQNISATNYAQLFEALSELTESGVEQATVNVEGYDKSRLATELTRAVAQVRARNPVAAYAVEKIEWDIGTSGGAAAVSFQIKYLHGRAEIHAIRQVEDMQEAKSMIADALGRCDASIVMQVEQYEPVDIIQYVADYAMLHPEIVMELPQVTVSSYPEIGDCRVLEIKFVYQTSRETLKNMQNRVESIFQSAKLRVSDENTEEEKLMLLYSYLMMLDIYTLETSITPAYSLLRYGVGDCKAFATVYASMCRQAELECYTVTGTRSGESWYWNIVRAGDSYLHVDVLRCYERGEFAGQLDFEMSGYVWDYSAYPICQEVQPENTHNSGE